MSAADQTASQLRRTGHVRAQIVRSRRALRREHDVQEALTHRVTSELALLSRPRRG